MQPAACWGTHHPHVQSEVSAFLSFRQCGVDVVSTEGTKLLSWSAAVNIIGAVLEHLSLESPWLCFEDRTLCKAHTLAWVFQIMNDPWASSNIRRHPVITFNWAALGFMKGNRQFWNMTCAMIQKLVLQSLILTFYRFFMWHSFLMLF